MTPSPDTSVPPSSMPPAPAPPVVIKIGGRSLEAPGAPRELAIEVASLAGHAVLVHGGGSEVSAWCERLRIVPRFEAGLRVTDDATLDVSVAVLAGLTNKRLVATLRDRGVEAVGLSGADGGLLDVELHPDTAHLGHVGRVRAAHVGLLAALMATGMTPVLSSIAAHQGRLLNVNADEVAGAVAAAMCASTLVLLSDAPGVLLAGRTLARIEASELDMLLAHPEVQGGMIPKLAAAKQALAAGTERVIIAAWQGPGTIARLLAGEGSGTWLTNSAAHALQHPSDVARTSDAAQSTSDAAQSTSDAAQSTSDAALSLDNPKPARTPIEASHV